MNHFEYQIRAHIATLQRQAEHYRQTLVVKPQALRHAKASNKTIEKCGPCAPKLAANTAK